MDIMILIRVIGQQEVTITCSFLHRIKIHSINKSYTIRLRKILNELAFLQPNSTIIYSDSQSVIPLTHNLKFHSYSKHIDTQYHYTHEKVHSQEIELQFISTYDMPS